MRNRRQPEPALACSCNGPQHWRAAKFSDNRRHIEDEHHSSIAQNRSATNKLTGREEVSESLDDQLFFANQAIHEQAELALAGADDDCEKTFASLNRVNGS